MQATPESTTEITDKTENDVEVEIEVEVHSIGCGPSPDREVEAIFTRELSVENSNDGKVAPANDNKATVKSKPASGATKVSIGTSPLPQECSTQVSSTLCKLPENSNQKF